MWFKTVVFSEVEKSLLGIVFWRNKCLLGLSIFFSFLLLLVNKRVTWRERVSAPMEIGKNRKNVWKRRIYTKYVSWNRLQKNAGRDLNAGVVLSKSRGSPGQWFPETEYLCASSIFVVGTSGIPPKLNYRSVKFYTRQRLNKIWWFSCARLLTLHTKNDFKKPANFWRANFKKNLLSISD